MDVFVQFMINAVIVVPIVSAIGFNVAYGTRKFVDMSYGASATMGGYAMFIFSRLLGWSVWPSWFFSVLSGGLLAWFLDLLIHRPLRHRHAPPLVSFISSLGAMIGLQSLFAIIFSTQFWVVEAPPGFMSKIYQIFSGSITGTQIIMTVSVLLLPLFVVALFRWTNFGRSLRAVGDDPEVSAIVGIPVEKVIGWSVFLSGALVGSAGGLMSIDTGVYPYSGLPITLLSASSGIIGGLGSIPGAILGAILVALIGTFGIWWFPSGWQMAIIFSVLLVFLLFRPNGILNRDK